MSTHEAILKWKRQAEPSKFTYENYNRDHTISYDGGITTNVSSAAKYGGNANFVDPEEMFVSALASCHMLTFLAMVTKKRYIVDSYKDTASCVLEKSPNGNYAVTRATLRPEVIFSGDKKPNNQQIEKMHHTAHKNCVVAHSVTTKIEIQPVFVNESE